MGWKIITAVFCLFLPCLANGQVDTIFKTFSLVQTENGVLIQFTMFGGATCNGIRIERSEDQVLFETVHEIVGVCGSSSTETNYSHTDSNPIRNTTSYYRLDAGLQGLFSGVRSITYINYGTTGITQFPNPCSSDCAWYIDNPNSEPLTCNLIDQQGKTIMTDIVVGTIWKPETNSVPQGLYLYTIRNESKLVFSGKLLIYKP